MVRARGVNVLMKFPLELQAEYLVGETVSSVNGKEICLYLKAANFFGKKGGTT